MYKINMQNKTLSAIVLSLTLVFGASTVNAQQGMVHSNQEIKLAKNLSYCAGLFSASATMFREDGDVGNANSVSQKLTTASELTLVAAKTILPRSEAEEIYKSNRIRLLSSQDVFLDEHDRYFTKCGSIYVNNINHNIKK